MRNTIKNINWSRLLNVSLWLITLVGLGFLMSFIKVKSSEFACNDLKLIIPGEQSFIATADVDKILKDTQGELVGKTLSAIPIHEIEKDLRTIPFVEKAMVSKDMSGTISIKIKQREAVLRVINQAGQDFYLDRNGVKMPLSARYAPRVLVVNGFVRENYGKDLDSIQTPLLHDLFEIANFIAADSLWDSQIEQLFVNELGQIELVPRVGKQKLIVGNAQDIDDKFNKLRIFYQNVIPSMGWNAYTSVDLTFKNQLVCEKSDNTK